MVSIAQILRSVDFRKVGMSKYCRKQPKKVKLYLTSLLIDEKQYRSPRGKFLF